MVAFLGVFVLSDSAALSPRATPTLKCSTSQLVLWIDLPGNGDGGEHVLHAPVHEPLLA
jgi:hypothetical protein